MVSQAGWVIGERGEPPALTPDTVWKLTVLPHRTWPKRMVAALLRLVTIFLHWVVVTEK